MVCDGISEERGWGKQAPRGGKAREATRKGVEGVNYWGRGSDHGGDDSTAVRKWGRTERKISYVESPPLLLLVIHIPIPRSSDEGEQDSSSVHTRNMQAEHEHSEQDG